MGLRAVVATLASACGRLAFDPLGGTASTCGGVGQPCCSGATACIANAYCNAGTCDTCIASVAFGRRFACVLVHDGTVWCSGENTVGQLGNGVMLSQATGTFEEVRDTSNQPIVDATWLGVGREHACVVRSDTGVWCWGNNSVGELGNGSTTFPQPPSPVAVRVVKSGMVPLTGIVSVAASYENSCAVDSSATVWCWGSGQNGPLGDGTTTTRAFAAPVLTSQGGPPFSGASELQLAGERGCVRVGADVWCWGLNMSGELGDQTSLPRLVPEKVATTTSYAAGMWTSCFVNPDTSVSCTGWGQKGRLGNGQSGSDVHAPVPVVTSGGVAFTGAARVAAGAFGCAIMTDSSLQCWGDDKYGQTATGASSDVPQPVLAMDGTPLLVDTVSAAWAHGCARTLRGELLCWGRGTEGEFGDGQFVNRSTPAPLPALCP